MEDFNKLTEEEKELIKNFRKNKSELVLETTLEENESYREWTRIDFRISDDIIHMNTVHGRFSKRLGFNDSQSGFYHRDLTKEDVKKIQKYFDYFLGGD